ncbi:unnamed protein product, partial [Polarella glacialis]
IMVTAPGEIGGPLNSPEASDEGGSSPSRQDSSGLLRLSSFGTGLFNRVPSSSSPSRTVSGDVSPSGLNPWRLPSFKIRLKDRLARAQEALLHQSE